MMDRIQFNPETDLKIERIVPITPMQVYEAWTVPALMVKWFTPAPWKTVAAEVDARPGGKCEVTMQSPEGETIPPMTGCVLHADPGKAYIFTSCLMPGFRPSPEPNFTGAILIEPAEGGAKYTAIAMHKDSADRNQHAEMGFEAGWNAALDQMIAMYSE